MSTCAIIINAILICAVLVCAILPGLPAFGQTTGSGSAYYAGSAIYGAWTGGTSTFFAALPLNYVDNTICNPQGQVYDTTIVLGTSVNNGPNVRSVALGGVYPATYLGLLDAVNNWRDNGSNVSGGSGYSDNWWLIEVPAQSSGTVLSSAEYDDNNAIISLPGKLETAGGAEPSKCLVIDSTTPLAAYNVAGSVTSGTFVAGEQVKQSTSGAQATLMNSSSLGNFTNMQLGPMYGYPSQTSIYAWVGQTSGAIFTPSSTPNPYMACGGGLPGFGGTRNPGCSSPDDKASMWKVELPAPQTASHIGIFAGADPVTSANWVNHIVLRDVEVAVAGGAAQSKSGVAAPRLVYVQPNPLQQTPCIGCQAVDHIGLERYYIHGNDPGDSGQPTSGASTDASGNCLSWYNSGTVTVSNAGGSTATVTLTSTAATLSYGNMYFGMTFTVGSTINLDGTMAGSPAAITGGANYVIAAFDPTSSNTVLTINTTEGGTLPASGSYNYLQVNPPSEYTPGCGDDVENGVVFDADSSWRESGYIEKIHWWGSESHASLQGFSNGPYKDVNNWEEGGSAAWFSGGSPVDQSGGPESDNEIRRNYLGRDLNYRQLSATTGSSPSPPWGCGTFDGTPAHNTCPFVWAIKNSMELKLGHRDLIDGNIIENSWPDGQQGFCVLINARVCSGGEACGVFNPSTGLPNTYIDNIRFSNNWVRNCPEPVQMSNRAGSPENGGGVSLPVQDNDFINNLFSNISDFNQFGKPGYEWEWTSGQDLFTCGMSYTGAGPYVVTANCLPSQSDISTNISKIASGASGVTINASGTSRWDPMLCTLGTLADCVSEGWTVNVLNHSGWNGTFAMTGTDGNWAADGTGGNNIIYADALNDPTSGTCLCDNAAETTCTNSPPKCTAALTTGDVTFVSLAYKMTDVSVGDDVYASNVGSVGKITNVAGSGTAQSYTALMPANTLAVGQPITITGLTQSAFDCSNCTVASLIGTNPQTGFTVLGTNSLASTGDSGTVLDTSCSAAGYAVGATSSTYAQTGTVTTGLTVLYNMTTQPGSAIANCLIDNGAGFPKYTTVQNNTFLASNVFDVEAVSQWWQPISNYFFNNVFVDNDSGKTSDIFCVPIDAGEGYPSYSQCWDANTFEFYGNVMVGRNSANWNGGTAVDPLNLCSGSGCANTFPALTSSYPTGSCGGATGAGQDAAAPFNCPLMALPWATNFSLGNLPAMSGSYSTQGVNVTNLQKAATQTEYTCPAGANCGAHGPYPD